MIVLANIISLTVVFAVPLLLVALGGMFSEHSGVINIALEGMMIIGALFACFSLQAFDKSGFGPDHPQLAMFCAILIAGACGSGTGGLGIAVSTLGPIYLDMGINPGLIHRIACVSCCGLDSLPHNGAVVTLLKYTGISHKDGYIHIGVTTVIVPLLTLALMVFLGAIGLTF